MKIGVLVPDQVAGELAVEIGKELGLEVYWVIAEVNNPLIYANELIQAHQIEAIIARNPTGYLLEGALPIPVTILHITRFDIIQAAEMIAPGKQIAFFYMPQDAEKYNYHSQEFTKHSVELISTTEQWFTKTEPTEASFDEIGIPFEKLMRYDTVITATLSIFRFMRKIGKEAVLIPFDPFDLRCAFRDAVTAVRFQNREKENTMLVEAALNSTDDGFLILKEDQVTMVNENLCLMANVSQKQILSQPPSALAKESTFFNEIFSINRKGIINCGGGPFSVFRRRVTPFNASEDDGLELISVINVPHIQNTERSIRRAINEQGFSANWRFPDIVAKSDKMTNTIKTAKQYAKSDSNVLILGETGVGKEMIAQSIHNASLFSNGPFVALNCAALPENLLESELFGYEEGAFTGAKKGGRAGLFERSHEGTLFLDEIGELPLLMQAKLLRCIQERCVYRLGGDRLIPVKNRLIFATNQDLSQLVKERRFRSDLFYRISILSLQIPPLRRRPDDVSPLAFRFLQQHSCHPTIAKRVASDIASLCEGYEWPGNARELEGLIERLFVTCHGKLDLPTIQETLCNILQNNEEGVPDQTQQIDEDSLLMISPGTMKEMETQILRTMYFRYGKNKQKVAKNLDLGYTTVWRRLKEYG